jgi:hypothetical protein
LFTFQPSKHIVSHGLSSTATGLLDAKGDATHTTCDSNLWDKALRHLQDSEKHKDILAIVEGFAKPQAASDANPKSGPGTAEGLAKEIKEKMEQEINSKQHDSGTRRFVERTVKVLNTIVPVVDVAVTFDPIHAALPWAAIRFVLVVSTSVPAP